MEEKIHECVERIAKVEGTLNLIHKRMDDARDNQSKDIQEVRADIRALREAISTLHTLIQNSQIAGLNRMTVILIAVISAVGGLLGSGITLLIQNLMN